MNEEKAIKLALFNYRKAYNAAVQRKDEIGAEAAVNGALDTIRKVLNAARSDENSRELNLTFDFQSSEEFKDGFDEAVRQVVRIKDARNSELQTDVTTAASSDLEASDA